RQQRPALLVQLGADPGPVLFQSGHGGRIAASAPRPPPSSGVQTLGRIHPRFIAKTLPGPCAAAKRRPAINVKWSTKNPNSAWFPDQCEGPWKAKPKNST